MSTTPSLDVAPVTVTTPWGERLEPVRVTLESGRLEVTDRDGRQLATATIRDVQRGRRTSTLETEDGARWTVREPCSCDGSKGRLRRLWAGIPRVAS